MIYFTLAVLCLICAVLSFIQSINKANGPGMPWPHGGWLGTCILLCFGTVLLIGIGVGSWLR